jgi:hypothetical protein
MERTFKTLMMRKKRRKWKEYPHLWVRVPE